MKKVLFIDRDGTLIIEPADYQVDSLQKLEFYPGVFQWLARIANETDYHLVLVTNQDGLGTELFPESDFWQVQNKIVKAFANENIVFQDVFIDKSLPEENLPTRKPGTAMLGKYLFGNYNMSESYVIGDRDSDVEFAENLGCRAIKLNNKINKKAVLCTQSWKDIYYFLKTIPRKGLVNRKTAETNVKVEVTLDRNDHSKIDTGLPFFDHMLQQLAKHSNMGLLITCNGDLSVDEHHTIEDVALALGEAINMALNTKKGIERFGFLLPMDDSLAQVAVDFGGRPWLEWDVIFNREKIGEVPTEMFFHFFKSFSDAAKCNLNIKASGQNEHHKIEAVFKAFANAIKMACSKNENYSIPSTKEFL